MSSSDADIGLVRAEAAAWLARLRADTVSAEDQAGFQAWLADDARHREAFESVTATWDLVGGAGVRRPMRDVMSDGTAPHRRSLLLGAVLVVAAGAGLAIWRAQSAEVYSTAAGEQRRVLLEDGSAVFLDTDTQVAVRLSDRRRDIELLRGRAFFDVAPDANRPFVVAIGRRSVTAVGTSFAVAADQSVVSAILEHGVILVSGDADKRPYLLSPGDRIRFAPDGTVARDRPDIALVLAWRQGRLGFDREALSMAVAEMNRYSRRPLVIEDPTISKLAISGLFTAGDNEAFANSLSLLLPVTARLERDRIVLLAAVTKKTRKAY